MVDSDKVQEVAENARINVTGEEASEFAEDFDEVLEMFEKLEEIDTEDVEPAFHPVDVSPDTRSDEKEDTLTREKVFRNTENEEEGFFRGPSA
ncbi:MAG: Asp-tRNA(Asn)/Glu-tRNA(Gln) amidotransferase subunit GatC [Candidatus Nanohalobium sp.]